LSAPLRRRIVYVVGLSSVDSSLDVRLLGPVQAVRGGRELSLGGPKQRAVLALLLLEAGRIVPTEALIEELWRGDPPAGAAKTLRSYLSRLRGVLRPELEIVARGSGYAGEFDSGHLDSRRFELLIGNAQDALASGEHEVATDRFRKALALWRGRALADVGEVESLAREAQRLEELRVVGLEGRIEAELALGLHAQLVGELEQLVIEYPLRERLWRLLVLALYRCERQADALDAHRRARVLLRDELGLEPGDELRRLELAILRQEVPVVLPPRLRHNLPAQLASFVGRDRELEELERFVGEGRLITLTGLGGVGKTRLALEFAARVVEKFAGGAWLVDLSGITEPELVPYELMQTFEVRQGRLEPVEALCGRLRDRELLLVLDNCEHVLDASTEMVGALLSGSPKLRVVATSREPLGLVGEVVYAVSPLAVPTESGATESTRSSPAVQLFLERAIPARGRGELDEEDLAVVGRICQELDGLPLAIELAAARTRALAVNEIETHLEDRFRFLRYWRRVAVARHQTLQATMDWSYELLGDEERRVLRELSVFAAGFGLAPVADICFDGDTGAALDIVESLVVKSLVVAETLGASSTRYRLLETVREYAGHRLAEAGEADVARRRHALSFLATAEREPDFSQLAQEQDNLRAALEWAVSAEPELGPRLARSLADFWLMRGLLQEARSWLERLLASTGISEELVAELLGLLGLLLYERGELDQSEAVLSQGLAIAGSLRLTGLEARLRVRRADARATRGSTGVRAAVEECKAAVALLKDEQDIDSLSEVWLVLGKHLFFLGESPADEAALELAARYARQVGNRRVELLASEWLAVSLFTLRVPTDVAIARQEELLLTVAGERWAEAGVLMPLALSYAYAGRFSEARETLARSRSTFNELGARLEWAAGAWNSGRIELLAGDLAAAERALSEGRDTLVAMGEGGYLSGIAALLAEALYRQGRLDEAQRVNDLAEETAAPDDPVQAQWRITRAKLFARSGASIDAERLLDEAEAILSATAYAAEVGEVLLARAEVQRIAGAPDVAARTLRKALELYEERRASALADQVRAALADLGKEALAEPI
jgi:predicted ATPase/DNA-binding SARP family transcriptional activator